MEIDTIEEQRQVVITVIQVKGRVNMGNADQLEAAARQAYESGARYFLVDLSENESLTSAGLRAILSIYKLLHENPQTAAKSSRLKLLCPRSDTLRVLTIAGFDRYLEIYSDRQQALDSYL
jgi:anti-anti-sigma factor